jgi:hypothetical protein
VTQGTGTTPACFNDFDGNEFVTIADNADPFLHILIYERNTGELLISQPVFLELPNRNAAENSIIAVNHTVFIENNYGNASPFSTIGPFTTEPGFSRIDFDPVSKTSMLVWENYSISIPSVVSILSTTNGFIYTYGKDTIGWYFAALDSTSGSVVAKAPVPLSTAPLGSLLANNYYGGLQIGPNGRVYVMVFGGIASWYTPEARR